MLAYRFVRGTPIVPGRCSPDLARLVGRLHGRLHTVDGDGLGPVQADGTSPKWPQEVIFREVPVWADRLQSASERTGIPGTDVEAALALIQAHRSAPRVRLLHGDASPTNTIVADSRVGALIDFDDAWFGEPAGDMAGGGGTTRQQPMTSTQDAPKRRSQHLRS